VGLARNWEKGKEVVGNADDSKKKSSDGGTGQKKPWAEGVIRKKRRDGETTAWRGKGEVGV